MSGNAVYIAIAVLVAFIAVWFLFIAPAERRHNERKLEMVRNQIEKRKAAAAEQENAEKYGASQAGKSSRDEPPDRHSS